ncbi:HNH endonuclease signature motif containing protein, partial [Knoellia sp. Soil729]|uniref:HNH endonuclease signature motif containing protein n=1 Tax=Knoellia sp. Soil729 TaxID=1736394 RepID=UPI001F375966
LAAIDPVRQEDGTTAEVHHGLGHQRLDAPELAAPRLGVSTHVAANRVLDAIRQLTRTPAVIDAMAEGDLDQRRAAVITEETEFLTAQDAASVVADVAPHWRELTIGPLRRLVAATAARVAPQAVAAEAERANQRRGLTRRHGEHGLDQWRADVLAEQSSRAWAAVTERARQLVRDGHADNLTQARVDALMRLVLEHSDVRVVVHTTRAATPDSDTTASGADDASGKSTPKDNTGAPADGWVEVGGLTGAGRTMVPASFLTGATAGGELTCHPTTGALLGGDVPAGLAVGRDLKGTSTATTPAYRIPAAMARFVRLRDGGCRFPGCAVPARQCDLDHVRPWPTGPTDPGNLIALCRRHHRIKQRDGWSVHLHPDRTLTWTDPSGCTTTTWPVDHLHHTTSTATPDGPRPARRTTHVNFSLLDHTYFELLLTAPPPPRPTRATTLPEVEPTAPAIDLHWTQLTWDPPPREPEPIPF